MRDTIPSTKLRLLPWFAVAGWMCVIFAGSSVPGSQVPGRFGSLGHFGEYAILGALLVLALTSPKRVLLAVALASAYGITDELHQLFVPGRMSDPVDWLVDTFGAIVGVYVATRIYRALRSRSGSPES